jgi:hypothetical protein
MIVGVRLLLSITRRTVEYSAARISQILTGYLEALRGGTVVSLLGPLLNGLVNRCLFPCRGYIGRKTL